MTTEVLCRPGERGPHYWDLGTPRTVLVDGVKRAMIRQRCRNCGWEIDVPAYVEAKDMPKRIRRQGRRVGPLLEHFERPEEPKLQPPQEGPERSDSVTTEMKTGKCNIQANIEKSREYERRKPEILAVWQEQGRHIRRAAAILGMSPLTLTKQLRRWGQVPPAQHRGAGRKARARATAEKAPVSTEQKEPGVMQRYKALEARKDEIIEIWEENDRRVTAAARALDIPVSTLFGKLRQWGLIEPGLERAEKAKTAEPEVIKELQQHAALSGVGTAFVLCEACHGKIYQGKERLLAGPNNALFIYCEDCYQKQKGEGFDPAERWDVFPFAPCRCETPTPAPATLKQEHIEQSCTMGRREGPVKFWMVLVDDTRGCTYKHGTLGSARKEAERLLRLPEHSGRGVSILEAVEYGYIHYPPVEWAPMRVAVEGLYQGRAVRDDLPF